MATSQTIKYTERMVGEGHPSLADTLNRLTLVSHDKYGNHLGYVDASQYASLAACLADVPVTTAVQISTTAYIVSGTTISHNLTVVSGGSLVLTGGTATINGSLVIASGGVFDVLSGTATINGSFSAGLYQCFSGAGTVTFGTGSTAEVYPEWWGIDGVADDVQIQAACTATSVKGIPVVLSNRTYNISAKIRSHNNTIIGKGKDYSILQATSPITILHITGAMQKYESFGCQFSAGDRTNAASIGIKLGEYTGTSGIDQCSNAVFSQVFVLNAYRGWIAESNGNDTLHGQTHTAAVWNNTFIDCLSYLCGDWSWYFDANVGSTTQTWINCMVNGVAIADGGTSKGWYISTIDDVSWINCQADDINVSSTADGCVYVASASSISIKNFRTEASTVLVDAGRLFYLNGSAEVDNLKIQACTFNPGLGKRVTIIGLGTTGNSTIGAMTFQACTITSGTLYKLDTAGLFDGYKCVITGGNIQRADVRLDNYATQTVFANKSVRYGTTQLDPTAGSFEIGDEFSTSIINTTTIPRVSRVCTTAGTAGTLGIVNATIDIATAPRKLTVDTIAGLKEGMFITIVGVTGTKRIVHISGTTTVYIDSDANASVTTAAVAYSAPVFRIDKQIVAKGTTANRPGGNPTSTYTTTETGIMYLDTGLGSANGIPIWWNGTAWVNSAGTVV